MAAEIAPYNGDLESMSQSLELDMAGQARLAEQMAHVRQLGAECDRLDANCGSLQVELHRMGTALFQARVMFMVARVKCEDLSIRPFYPIPAQTQSHFTFSPMQEPDTVARSIPRKRPCPVSGDDDIAYARKRRRCG
jgi:hypothetical protein